MPDIKDNTEFSFALVTCVYCGLEACSKEDLKLFVANKNGEFGVTKVCKKCNARVQREWRKNHPFRVKQINKANLEKRKAYNRKFNKEKPEVLRFFRFTRYYNAAVKILEPIFINVIKNIGKSYEMKFQTTETKIPKKVYTSEVLKDLLIDQLTKTISECNINFTFEIKEIPKDRKSVLIICNIDKK